MPTVGGDRGGAAVGTPDNVYGVAGTGQGFYTPQGSRALWLYTGQAAPWPASVASGLDVQQNLTRGADGTLWDPLGMWQSGTYISATFGETWGPFSWFRLPVGFWALNLATKWDGNTTGDRESSLGIMDDRQLATGIDPFWWAPSNVENISNVLRVPAATLSAGFQGAISFCAVTPAMVNASDAQSARGQGVALGYNLFQNSGAPRGVTYATVAIVPVNAWPVP